MRQFLILGFIIVASFNGFAGDRAAYSTPAAGTPIRKQLMDTLRVPAEKHLGQPVIFKVGTLRVQDDWALFVGTAIQPNGSLVDYRKSLQFKADPKETRLAMDAGMLFGGIDALLKKGANGWKVVTINYDAGDVHWLDYDTRFGAPHRMIADPIQ